MVSAKDEMLMKCMKVWMTRFNTEDLKFLEDTFWMVSFNFQLTPYLLLKLQRLMARLQID